MSDEKEAGQGEMPDLDGPPNLGGAVAVGFASGILGLVPVCGAVLEEVVREFIPDQRRERLNDYLRLLHQRLARLEEEELRRRFRQPENVDLFEEGAFQAARALSDDRKRYIANLVASGISGDEAERLRAKRLLNLLREIDDDQIIILTSKLRRHLEDQAFHERHAAVLKHTSAVFSSSRDELDRATVHEQAAAHLIRLGLLGQKFARPGLGRQPELDEKTGMIKAAGTEITPLGRLLLRHIGLAGPDEL
jgi:hypothetical protein